MFGYRSFSNIGEGVSARFRTPSELSLWIQYCFFVSMGSGGNIRQVLIPIVESKDYSNLSIHWDMVLFQELVDLGYPP